MKKIYVLLVLLIGILLGYKFINQKAMKDSIFDYKTKYVGDASAVIGVVNVQGYPKDARPNGIKILSDQEPYGLNIYLEKTKDSAKESLFDNAVITFALIDNLDKIYYINKSDEKLIISFTKDEVNEELKVNNLSILGIGSSKESFQKYLDTLKKNN